MYAVKKTAQIIAAGSLLMLAATTYDTTTYTQTYIQLQQHPKKELIESKGLFELAQHTYKQDSTQAHQYFRRAQQEALKDTTLDTSIEYYLKTLKPTQQNSADLKRIIEYNNTIYNIPNLPSSAQLTRQLKDIQTTQATAIGGLVFAGILGIYAHRKKD